MKTLNLHLGCGLIKKEQHINIDRVKTAATDMVWDLNKFPYPFANDRVDSIIMTNVLEHLKDPIRTLFELHRILKPRGELFIEVPHFTNPNNYNDPTHTTLFGYDWFNPFVVGGSNTDFYFETQFSKMEKCLLFTKKRFSILKVLQYVANKNPKMYEWLKPFPCMRLKVKLIK